MATVFKVERSSVRITEVECQKSTPQSVWIKRWRLSGDGPFERHARWSQWYSYFDTWEQAHAHLLDRATNRVQRAKAELQSARSELGQIESMKREASR